MKTILLRPTDPERDFSQIAALFSNEQGEPVSESGLKQDYEEHKERIIRLIVAEDKQGELLGFNWAVRSRFEPNEIYFFLIVKPEKRKQGAGSRLYEDLLQAAWDAQTKKLQVSIRDNRPECRAFADKRGFAERSHFIELELDLDAFDARPYERIIDQLRGEGFRFTTMEELGNTEDAQRKLYDLNDTTAREMPGSGGEPVWLSFEDFRSKVCLKEWYRPGGQIVAIDTAVNVWAAMSAITRFEGSHHAYNLHTGVDRRYQGRKLEQVMLALALRHARYVLKSNRVHTDENTLNQPMLAVYHEFGYAELPGTFSMEKLLEEM